MNPVRRHFWGYTFRAWVNKNGSNLDHDHEHFCLNHHCVCKHLRLWDASTPGSKNILRVVRRGFWPVSISIGPKYWSIP